MATAREDRNSTSEPPGFPLERALIANEMRVYSEQDKVLINRMVVSKDRSR